MEQPYYSMKSAQCYKDVWSIPLLGRRKRCCKEALSYSPTFYFTLLKLSYKIVSILLGRTMVYILYFLYNIVASGGVYMKHVWNYKFEISITTMGVLLIINFFFPTFMPAGLHTCLLLLFVVSVILLKLSNISYAMKNKARQGGILWKQY